MKPTGHRRAPSVGSGKPTTDRSSGYLALNPGGDGPSFTRHAVSEMKPLSLDTAMTLRETVNPEVARG